MFRFNSALMLLCSTACKMSPSFPDHPAPPPPIPPAPAAPHPLLLQMAWLWSVLCCCCQPQEESKQQQESDIAPASRPRRQRYFQVEAIVKSINLATKIFPLRQLSSQLISTQKIAKAIVKSIVWPKVATSIKKIIFSVKYCDFRLILVNYG